MRNSGRLLLLPGGLSWCIHRHSCLHPIEGRRSTTNEARPSQHFCTFHRKQVIITPTLWHGTSQQRHRLTYTRATPNTLRTKLSHGLCDTEILTPCVTFRRVVAPSRGPGQSPGLPFACCVGSLRSVGRCGRCSCWCRFRVRGATSSWCVGAVLNVAGCDGCASAGPNNWPIEDVLVVAGVV